MKYIKTYENVKYFYNPPIIGGYYLILYADSYYKAQLIDIRDDSSYSRPNSEHSAKYIFDVFIDDLDKDYFYVDNFTSKYIERELTPSEIEIYKMKKEANKYNL